MSKNQSGTCNSRNGVALIMVIGMLSVITLLSVAFSIAMRIERLAARNHANAARAEHLINTAFVVATTNLNIRMQGKCYPKLVEEAYASALGTDACTNLLSGEARAIIPKSLLTKAQTAAANCKWIKVEPLLPGYVTKTAMRARFAYLVCNASGLLDGNKVGGGTNAWTSVRQLEPGDINIDYVTDFVSGMQTRFLDNRRDKHIRYDTVTELLALNPGCFNNTELSTLSAYSYDLSRAQYFPDSEVANLGTPTVKLEDKFYVNGITNFACYRTKNTINKYKNDAGFISGYYDKLLQALKDAKLNNNNRTPDIAWNIVNWLDEDRVPQSAEGDNAPWVHTEGGEAIPLINEIILKKGGGVNEYTFTVELWFPFTGPDYVKVDKSEPYHDCDKFVFQAAVWDLPNPQAKAPTFATSTLDFSTVAPAPKKVVEIPIEFMRYPDAQFKTFDVGPIVMDGPLAVTNCLFFTARVAIKDGSTIYPVDQANGMRKVYQLWNGAKFEPATATPNYMPVAYTAPGAWGVDDPRSNGKNNEWGPENDPNGTPNALNKGLNLSLITGKGGGARDQNPWCTDMHDSDNRRQGVPIYVKDGLMQTIGECGFFYLSNYGGEVGTWDTVDIMHAGAGAYLIDHLTVRDPKRENSTNGLVCINTQQKDVLRALFGGVKVGMGIAQTTGKNMAELQAKGIDAIVDAITTRSAKDPFLKFQDMFKTASGPSGTSEVNGGPIAKAIRDAAKAAWVNKNPGPTADQEGTHDRVLEDAFNQIVDLISFRQNIYTVVCAAQVLANQKPSRGEPEIILGERRAIATLYRDSYTGRTFVRSFKWLSEE